MPPKFAVIALVGSLLAAAGSSAGESEVQSTTEFGITVTPEEVYDVIQETADYWPPVQRHVAGPEFAVASEPLRRDVAEFIAEVNQTLHDRLFGDDESQAEDVILYVQARVRVFGCYRQLREALGDDAALIHLKNHWEDLGRRMLVIPEPSRSMLAMELPAEMKRKMLELQLPPERIAAAEPLWKRLAACEAKRNATAAGRRMLDFEREAIAGDPERAELLRRVVAAADWSVIVKPTGRIATKRDFLSAWDTIEGGTLRR